jgi:tagatose 1,6-diphosphate aldolase
VARAAGHTAFSGDPVTAAPIHGVAVDAGSGLAAAIRAARGADAEDDDLFRFKQAVLTTLGPGATTVLVDAALGRRLLPLFPAGCAPMMAYEADVYHISDSDRITVLPHDLKVDDYQGLGVGLLKFFLWYAPDDDPALNARKCALVEQVGKACAATGVSFLMEPLVYHPIHVPGTPAFAAIKPDLVRRAVEVFSDPRYGVRTLKIEVPVDLAFVAGFGQPQRSQDEALAAFRRVTAAARGLPVVFLSAGVPFEAFEASLRLACASGARFDGFMCGRALWSEAIHVFGEQGESAMVDWLMTIGRARLARLIAAVEGRDAA